MITWLRYGALIISLSLFLVIGSMIFISKWNNDTRLANYFEALKPGHVIVPENSGNNQAFLSGADPFILYGICRFDIRQDDFEIELPFWHDYWSISFMSPKGKITSNLSRRPLVSDQEHLVLTTRPIVPGTSQEQKTISRINPETDQGLVLFRLATVNDEIRQEGTALLRNLLCRALPR